MERDIKAFFYEYKYYLFPEDCLSLEELKERTFVRTKRLKEEFCMAPNFVYESIAEEDLEIEDANRLFEVSVNLYSREEYDEVLEKQVRLHCPGCSRYEQTVDENGHLSLDGHHREISLDGVCYERETEEESWSFSFCAEYFWYLISHRLRDLAICIDRNNQKKLNKLLNAELTHFCFPVNFYGTRTNGTYHLYMSAGKKVSPLMANVIAFLAAAAGEEEGLTSMQWEVHPFLPAGIRSAKWKFKTLSFYLAPSPIPGESIVRILHPKAQKLSEKKRDQLIGALDDYLSAELGENVVGSVVAAYEIVWDDEKPMSMSELKAKLREMYDEVYNGGFMEDGVPVPYPVFCPYARNEESDQTDWWLPYKNLAREGMTSVPELSFLERADAEKREEWWTALFDYIYLYIPRPIDSPENIYATLQWYMQNMKQVPEPLRNPKDRRLSAMYIGTAECAEHGFLVESLVADEKKFFRTLRILAPVLRAYDAKAVVVSRDGVQVYACGYTFSPVENWKAGIEE